MKYRMERYIKPVTTRLRATDGTRYDWEQAYSEFEATSPEEAIAYFEQRTGHFWTAAFRLISLSTPGRLTILAATNCFLE